jgi:hypothetical protein
MAMIMKHIVLRLCNVSLVCIALSARAYEQITHAAMTREAAMQSELNPLTSDVYQRLGIADKQASLINYYINISNTAYVIRSNDPDGAKDVAGFGATKINLANNHAVFKPVLNSILGWLMLGAIREDDVPYDAGAAENNPQDEPGGPIPRVLNHFYDPYNDQPLTVSGSSVGSKAVDWALGQGNDFAVSRAREAMWRAVTLKYSPAQGLADLPFVPTAAIPTKEALRIAYWATTFRALGDVVHLLQDMAQPQHTRNDAHSGMFCGYDILSNNQSV